MELKYDNFGNIKDLNIPEYNVIKKDDSIMVNEAKQKVQKEQFNQKNLSIVTEQGMFGELGLEDPNVINVNDKILK